MDKKYLDFSDKELFTDGTTKSIEEEHFSLTDIQCAKRYLFLVKLRIESRRKDFLRKLNTLQKQEELQEDFHLLDICTEDYYFDYPLDWTRHISNATLLDLLNDLPLNQQRVLWGIFVRKETQKYLSNQLSISPVAVHKTVQRAIKQLRKGLC